MAKKAAVPKELPDAWKPQKYPKALGACIDLVYELREQRLAIEKEVEAMKAEEEKIKLHISESFNQTGLDAAKGKLGQASTSIIVLPKAEDWTLIHKHIQKTGDFDLLHKALTAAACAERWDAGIVIPGISQFKKKKINISKVGEK